MRGLHLLALCAATLIHTVQDSSAGSVFRCEDAGGHITFTRHGCNAGQQQQVQAAHNHNPGSGRAAPMAQQTQEPKRRSTSELVIVGQQSDGCGNRVTGSERRQAIIRKEIRSGMTRDDVESSLGKPDKVSRQNGTQRYHYRDNDGNTRQVSFDEFGCVKGK